MKLHEHLFGNGKPLRCNAWAKPRLNIYFGPFGPDVFGMKE